MSNPFSIRAIMKTLLLAIALTTSLTCSAEPGLPPALLGEFTKKWPHNRAINLVFHGHSVPAGYHKTPEVKPFESYPHLLHQELTRRFPDAVIHVIITAIGGENSIPGDRRFERDVLTHKPDVIFIDYALNDRRQDEAKVEAAWRSMVRKAKEKNIPVILLTPTGDSSADLPNPEDPLCQRAQLVRRVAEAESVPLADVFSAWRAEVDKGTPQTDLLSQINHPNLRGHQLAAGVLGRFFPD